MDAHKVRSYPTSGGGRRGWRNKPLGDLSLGRPKFLANFVETDRGFHFASSSPRMGVAKEVDCALGNVLYY